MFSQRMSVQADLCKVIHSAEAEPDRHLGEFMACREPMPEGYAPVKILEPRKMPVGRNLHGSRARQIGAVLADRPILLQDRPGNWFALPFPIQREPLPHRKRDSGHLARLYCIRPRRACIRRYL